jgi:exopolyphosphatase/guanosine-5'-triphosphate,3'-diphosphate pyrophosphatase
MIRASIDIGSNSVLLLACEFNSTSQEIEKEILNLSYITSLGKDLDKTKQFHPDSMKATYEALKDYKKQLEKISFDPADVIVTATEASRVATNAPEFFKKIKDELGFHITKISAKGEAHYTALGVASAVDSDKDIVIMDMGGASTELILVQLHPFEIKTTVSLPVGSVRATDWRADGSFNKRINEILNVEFSEYKTKNLVCVAGSMTSLASMFSGHTEFKDKEIDGLKIKFESFKEFSRDLQKTNVENLLLLFPYLGKRAPMVGAASAVAEMIGEKLNIETMQISTRGLRYGVLIKGEIDETFII